MGYTLRHRRWLGNFPEFFLELGNGRYMGHLFNCLIFQPCFIITVCKDLIQICSLWIWLIGFEHNSILHYFTVFSCASVFPSLTKPIIKRLMREGDYMGWSC